MTALLLDMGEDFAPLTDAAYKQFPYLLSEDAKSSGGLQMDCCENHVLSWGCNLNSSLSKQLGGQGSQ